MNVCPECGLTFDEGGFCTQDGAQLVAIGADPIVGTMLGPYRVVALVGTGGMGRVYKGVNPTIRSRVAIKVLSHECSERAELIERFFAEARAVNLIRHENIVNVLDLSRLPDGRPYIVMEYLDGSPLSQLIAQRGRLPAGTLGVLMGEVLAALGAAHEKGVVHRDIKPDNLFVTLQGRAKVLDFGIAKLATEHRPEMDPTRAGSLLGTPHYMSPEQAQSRPADARADLYAIGVILYEATTGRKPFTGASVFEILRGHIEMAPVPPRQLAADLPPAYEQLILRALAKDPAHRWQSSYELGSALSAACQMLPATAWEPLSGRGRNESVGPPTPSSIPRLPPAPPRNRRTAIVVAATFVLAAAVAAGVVLAIKGGSSSPVTVAAAPASAPTAPDQPTADAPTTEAIDRDMAIEDPPATAKAVPRSAQAPVPDRPGSAKAAPSATRGGGSAPLPAAAHAAAPVPPTATGEAAKDAAKVSPPAARGRRTLDERINENNPTPTAWDVTGYLPKAHAAAKSYFPDAVLLRIDAGGVYPSGKANLKLDSSFDVTYRFMSPSAAVRPKDLPLGVEHKPTCKLYVVVEADEITVYTLQGWSCDDEEKIRMPRCSAKEVWARAAAKGVPTDNAVASLSYRIFRNRPTWLLEIGKEHDQEIPDDC
jgi:serine/threonine protein kinase